MQNLGVLATKISILEILCSVLLFVCCKDGLYEYLLDVTLINLCCPACCKVFSSPPSTIVQPVGQKLHGR